MAISMETVMQRIGNFFQRGCAYGEHRIAGNVLTPAPSAPWVAIRGSLYHDGVYQCCSGYLQGVPEGKPDETFEGRVWLLHPPDNFVALVEEIKDYDARNPVGAYHSETFGEYGYTRDTGRNGAAVSWFDAFWPALTPYRRMFREVD